MGLVLCGSMVPVFFGMRSFTTFPQSGNPRQWLAEYLRTRAHLASDKSDFHCEPACTRPGCKNQDVQVPAGLVDLMGAALHRDESVSDNYQRNYTLGLLANERDDWIRSVFPRLKKPCPFLENDLCSIYPVRPLACVLFPEYLVYRGDFEAHAGKDHFKDFLCLQRPFLLSPERGKVIAKLRRMWEREALISNFYLFDDGHCHIDFSDLGAEISQVSGSLSPAESGERAEPPGISNQALEHFFGEHIADCQPFAGVSEKIHHLNNREGQVKFLQFLQDEQLLKKLIQAGEDRAMVFRFIDGKLKAKRRGIIPTEYKFH